MITGGITAVRMSINNSIGRTVFANAASIQASRRALIQRRFIVSTLYRAK